MINKKLEYLSNKVRMGIPISLEDAIKVIDYQNREKSIFDKIVGWYYYYSGKTGKNNDQKNNIND